MINIKKKVFFIIKIIFSVIIFLTLILFFYAAFFYKNIDIKKTTDKKITETNEETDQTTKDEENQIIEEENEDIIETQPEEIVKIEIPVISDGLFMTVGNKPITSSDIVNEIKTILILNNQSYSDERREELQKLAINAIIKRSIKEIELDKNNYFKLNEEDLRLELVNLAAKMNVDVETLKNICSSNNLDFSIIEQQVKVELFWNSLVFEIYKNKLIVSPEEVEDQLKLIQNEKKMNEYLISEIIIKKVDKEMIEVKTEELINKIKNEGFESTAKILSISKSAANGGDLGWIKEDSISGEIKNILINTQVGNISEPIFLPAGILIFKVRNKREIESALTLEEMKDQLVYSEKLKILQMYSLSHYDKLRKTISVNFKQ